VDAFVDAVILVDLLRNYPPSIQWRNANSHLVVGISAFVWMEVIAGAQNKLDQHKAALFLKQFTLTYPIQADIEWAMRQFRVYHLSHNVGILDCLIAAPSHRFQLPLLTRNLKHFTSLLGRLAQQPY
jgi:predicted nucleic acid-binding protein